MDKGNKEKEFPKFSLYVSFIFQLPFEILKGQAAQSRHRLSLSDGIPLLPAVFVLGFVVSLY
jgi:hypothetical protein